MDFLNRHSELSRLKKNCSRTTASLSIVYGRRRIGKSRLIKEVLKEKGIYFMADQSEAVRQIELFAKQIALQINGFDKVVYPNWEALFDSLNYRVKKGTTICIDEFPYLIKSTPALPSILQRIWDNKQQLHYHLILCGSSQQLMHSLVFNAAAPLYGRANEIMKIEPISVYYLQKALNTSAIQTIIEYSIWGGIPRYWELRLTEKDLLSAIHHHVFSSQGILYNEPVHLFLDDMRDTVHSFTLLSLIATGCNRLSEIAARIEKPATHLSAPLNKLIQLGYLQREIPFGENEKNSKRSLYKINDSFLDFYFQFIVPHRSLIAIEKKDILTKLFNDKLPQYVSAHWEKICRQSVALLKINQLQFQPASRYWGTTLTGSQIELDIVALSTNNKYLLVGECKWNEKAINENELMNKLKAKAASLPFAKDKEIIPALFLKTTKNKSLEQVYTPQNIIDLWS
jgi:AAA+ ATPase superfamily predicted ATPase